jgi:uncharacterized protein (DUF427 family)
MQTKSQRARNTTSASTAAGSIDHPITITSGTLRVVVTVGGRVVADTREARTLHEADYPPVHYIPRNDVDMSLLERTDHATYCPYKGDCAYYDIRVGDARSTNAAWTYEAPYTAVAVIKDHLAFYPDRVDAIEQVTPFRRCENAGQDSSSIITTNETPSGFRRPNKGS